LTPTAKRAARTGKKKANYSKPVLGQGGPRRDAWRTEKNCSSRKVKQRAGNPLTLGGKRRKDPRKNLLINNHLEDTEKSGLSGKSKTLGDDSNDLKKKKT